MSVCHFAECEFWCFLTVGWNRRVWL